MIIGSVGRWSPEIRRETFSLYNIGNTAGKSVLDSLINHRFRLSLNLLKAVVAGPRTDQRFVTFMWNIVIILCIITDSYKKFSLKTWTPLIYWEGLKILFNWQTQLSGMTFRVCTSTFLLHFPTHSILPKKCPGQPSLYSNYLATGVRLSASVYWCSCVSLSFKNHPTFCHSIFSGNVLQPVSQKRTALLRTGTLNEDAANHTDSDGERSAFMYSCIDL